MHGTCCSGSNSQFYSHDSREWRRPQGCTALLIHNRLKESPATPAASPQRRGPRRRAPHSPSSTLCRNPSSMMSSNSSLSSVDHRSVVSTAASITAAAAGHACLWDCASRALVSVGAPVMRVLPCTSATPFGINLPHKQGRTSHLPAPAAQWRRRRSPPARALSHRRTTAPWT